MDGLDYLNPYWQAIQIKCIVRLPGIGNACDLLEGTKYQKLLL